MSATAPGRTQGSSFAVSTLMIAKRTLLKFLRTPQLIVFGTLQSVMFLLIFRYVFGGAIATGGLSYVDFLVPGFITTGILFGGIAASGGVAEDAELGLLDRLRSLPIPRASFLAGRALADTGLLVWSLIVMTAIGFLVGFHLHASVLSGLEALLLLVVYGFAFEWLFIMLGMLASNAQAAQQMGLLIFPFTFISSAFVEVRTMPGWMRAIANHQPVTFMADSVRALTQGHVVEARLGHSASYFVGRSLLWSVALVVVFAPIAVARYRKG